MPECASTGCRRERFAFVAFFRNRAVRWLRGVFCSCSALFLSWSTHPDKLIHGFEVVAPASAADRRDRL